MSVSWDSVRSWSVESAGNFDRDMEVIHQLSFRVHTITLTSYLTASLSNLRMSPLCDQLLTGKAICVVQGLLE